MRCRGLAERCGRNWRQRGARMAADRINDAIDAGEPGLDHQLEQVAHGVLLGDGSDVDVGALADLVNRAAAFEHGHQERVAPKRLGGDIDA